MATPKQSNTTTVFDYCWTQVAEAFWNRYPNPYSSHVLTEDTIIREVRDGKLYTRRLLSKTNPLPKWGKRFYNAKSVKIVEDSILDPEKKILITFTQNVGFTKIMKVDEHVIYTERADGKTIVNRTAWVSSRVFGFSRAIRAFGAERFKSNCHKTAVGFNYVLKNMFPNHKPLQIIDSTTTGIVSKADHQQSKIGKLKRAAWATYNFSKSQTIKLIQLFSVKS